MNAARSRPQAHTPKISVIMAGHNCAPFVTQALRSIMRQTLQDVEIIFVDDGSTDDTLQIVEQHASKDNRIRVSSRENRGLPATLNEMIAEARAPWVARMDADDIALPNRLASQLAWAEKHSLDVCGGWTSTLGALSWRTRRYPVSDDAIKLLLCFRTAFSHPTVIMRTELARRIPYNPQLKRAQDYDLWTRLAIEGARMGNLPEHVLRYRVHAGQASAKHAGNQAESRQNSQQTYLSALELSPALRDLARRFSGPACRPTIDEAQALADELLPIAWATSATKIQILSLALRYVRPASPEIFKIANVFRKKLDGAVSAEFFSLFLQSYMRASSSSLIYRVAKRFV